MTFNISDIFLQVRALGESYYLSDIEPLSSRLPKNFDPLKYIIRTFRINGIRIHAWVNMFYIWSGNTFPENPDIILLINTQTIYLRSEKFPDYKNLKGNGI